MVTIFLSYAHSDEAIAAELQRVLTTHGLNVTTGMAVPAGANISKSVLGGMEDADAFVFLISKQFMKSQWTQIEVAAAMAQVAAGEAKRIIPVLVDPNLDSREDVPPLLQRFVGLDMREGFSEQRVTPLVMALTGSEEPARFEEQLRAERELLGLRWQVQKSELAHERMTAEANLAEQVRRQSRMAIYVAMLSALLAGAAGVVVGVAGEGSRDDGALDLVLAITLVVNLLAVSLVSLGMFREQRGWRAWNRKSREVIVHGRSD